MRWHLHWSSISVAVPLFRPALLQTAPVAPLPSISSMVKPAGHISRGRGFGGGSLSPFRGHHGHAFILERVHKQNVFAICMQRKICAPTFSHSLFFRAEKKKNTLSITSRQPFLGRIWAFRAFWEDSLSTQSFLLQETSKRPPFFSAFFFPAFPITPGCLFGALAQRNRYDNKNLCGPRYLEFILLVSKYSEDHPSQ